jgi:FeS assembly SUF system protein
MDIPPPNTPPTPSSGPPPGNDPREALKSQVVEALRQVYDPEIPVNIFDIGLIYGIEVDPPGSVRIRMTLTSPSCPSAEVIPVEVEERLKALPGVTAVKVEVVWEPVWTPEKMSEAAKLQLGML